AGPEIEAQLSGAADGTAPDPPEVDDTGEFFFEGTGDRDHHIPWLQRATPRDDRDPRENGLGISAGRQGGERIHPAKGEEDDCEVNRSPVPGRESGHTH